MNFTIDKFELFALRKLALVSKALGETLTGEASREQRFLAKTLVDVLDRYEIEAARGQSERG